MLNVLHIYRVYGLFRLRVFVIYYLWHIRPVGLGVGFGAVEIVLIAGKAIDTMMVAAFLVVFGAAEGVAFLAVGEWVVFGPGCFSSRDDR